MATLFFYYKPLYFNTIRIIIKRITPIKNNAVNLKNAGTYLTLFSTSYGTGFSIYIVSVLSTNRMTSRTSVLALSLFSILPRKRCNAVSTYALALACVVSNFSVSYAGTTSTILSTGITTMLSLIRMLSLKFTTSFSVSFTGT